jgi:hypothetical protein
MKVLAFYSENFDGATIAGDLEMLMNRTVRDAAPARKFRKHASNGEEIHSR